MYGILKEGKRTVNELIEKILKADEEARKKSQAIEERRAHLEADITEAKNKMKAEYDAAADEEIKKQLEEKRKAAEISWNEASKKYKKLGDDLKFSYNSNYEKWASEIAEKVIEGV